MEIAPVEGDAAKPPVDVIPMSIPTEEFDPSLEEKFKAKSVGFWKDLLEILFLNLVVVLYLKRGLKMIRNLRIFWIKFAKWRVLNL